MKLEDAMSLKKDVNKQIELEVYMTKNTYSLTGKLLSVDQDPELTEAEKQRGARRRTWLTIKLSEDIRHSYYDSLKKGKIQEVYISKIKEWVVLN